MININEAIIKIRAAGASKVRCVPMPSQNVQSGMYQIEILNDSKWECVATGMPKMAAESIIQQAINNVICG